MLLFYAGINICVKKGKFMIPNNVSMRAVQTGNWKKTPAIYLFHLCTVHLMLINFTQIMRLSYTYL